MEEDLWWICGHGKASGRPAKPTDESVGAVVPCDPATKTSRSILSQVRWRHGLEYDEGLLWVTCPKVKKLAQVNQNRRQSFTNFLCIWTGAQLPGMGRAGIWCMAFHRIVVIQNLVTKDC